MPLPSVIAVTQRFEASASVWSHPWLAALIAALTGVLVAVLIALLVARRRHRDTMASTLRESEARYRYLFESNPQPMWVYDLRTLRFLAVNETAIHCYGYTRTEFDAMTIRDIRPVEDVAKLEKEIPSIDTAANMEGLWRHRKKDGTVIDVEIVSNPFDFGGRPARLVLANDITERMRIERGLQESERRYRLLFDSTPLPTWVRDDGSLRFLMVNDAAVRHYGYTRDEFLAMRTVDVRPPEDVSAYREALPANDARNDAVHTVRHRQKDGAVINVELTAHAFIFNGRPAHLVIINDITERHKAGVAIRELNVELERRVLERTAELEAANTELEAFSYSVSHDLRAPLRSIDGFSKALLEDYMATLDDNGRDFLNRMRAASQRMSELIDSLLALSRVTRTAIVRSRVDLSALATEIGAELRRVSPQRSVEFSVGAAIMVNADPNLMRITLENLLDNAWKFTRREDRPRIEFGITGAEGKTAYFVRDNGAGFNMAYADKLFGAFQRLHAAQDFPGTGIGLATVKRIVRRHGGDVWATAEIGHGATFYFTLG